jgi:hypothetical protein
LAVLIGKLEEAASDVGWTEKVLLQLQQLPTAVAAAVVVVAAVVVAAPGSESAGLNDRISVKIKQRYEEMAPTDQTAQSCGTRCGTAVGQWLIKVDCCWELAIVRRGEWWRRRHDDWGQWGGGGGRGGRLLDQGGSGRDGGAGQRAVMFIVAWVMAKHTSKVTWNWKLKKIYIIFEKVLRGEERQVSYIMSVKMKEEI